MTDFIHRLFAERATVLSVNHTRFVRIAVKPLIGATTHEKALHSRRGTLRDRDGDISIP